MNVAPSGRMLFGRKQVSGIGGCLGGFALLALAVGSLFMSAKSGRYRGGIFLGLFALSVLASTFSIKGVELQPDGLLVWNFIFWAVGRRRFIPKQEIRSFELGDDAGKFALKALLNDGSEIPIPTRFNTLKDAQQVVDFATEMYGTGAELAIESAPLLAEAATFAKAKRWSITPRKKSRADGERLLIEDEDGNAGGEIRIVTPWFGSQRIEIAEGPGGLDASGARWTCIPDSKEIMLSDRGTELPDVYVLNPGLFQSMRALYWTDANKTEWSAVFTSENEKTRTPFTLKIYRGIESDLAKKRKTPEAPPGEVVAIADGDAATFTLDVADESAWPWIRIALAATWVRFRPVFNFKK